MNKFQKILIWTVGVFVIVYMSVLFVYRTKDPIIKWNWEKIDTNQKLFPKNFLWGVATAAHQIEGGHQNINNWGWWEKQTLPNGKSTVYKHQKSGRACDSWNLYMEDIHLMKNLGVNAYRFSVSWSKIMPAPDKFDSKAIRHYKQMCDSLLANGITPMVTLFHFTYPLWFQHLGGFEKKENIKYFVEFSEKVYDALHQDVKFWCTVNEPSVFVYDGYFNGNLVKGKKSPLLAAKVLENIIEAHVQVYKTLKAKPDGEQAQIGIVKDIFQMDPYRKFNLFDNIIAHFADNGFNKPVLRVFKDGKYIFSVPGIVKYKSKIPGAPESLDFIGLNYYSHNAFKFVGNLDKSFTPLLYKGETPTDMGYGIYPEGIYRAIKRISKLNKPIYITENGIADSTDVNRAEFINKYLYAVSKAIEDGYDVRGYFYWSLMDNFEWSKGYSMKFGLYKVDFKTEKRTLRQGAKEYIKIIKSSNKK